LMPLDGVDTFSIEALHRREFAVLCEGDFQAVARPRVRSSQR
jgi:hypothetical protein